MTLTRQKFVGVLVGLMLALSAYGVGVLTAAGGRPVAASASDSWQLPAGNFQASIHTLELWYPRPDGSTQAYAYHRRAPAGYDRVITLGIAGGRPPWYVTINGGPSGMTVNNDPTSSGYLDLTIPSVTVSSTTINLTIEDQCAGSINPTWSWDGIAEDNTTYFVHLDDGAGGTEAGTLANPCRSLGCVLGATSGATTWQGRQVIVLPGTHTISGQTAAYSSNNSRLTLNTNKPQIWACATAGTCTFQGSVANTDGAGFSASGTNVVFYGFNWTNPHVDEVGGGAGERNIFVHGSASAFAFGGFFHNTFTGTAAAGDSGSNSTAIMFAAGTAASYAAVCNNTFDDFDEMTLVMWYDSNHQVICGNTVTNSSVPEGFFIKGGDADDDFEFAFNRGITNNSGRISKIQAIAGTTFSRQRIEFMHNTWKSSVMGIWALGAAGDSYSIYSTRNSWKIPNHEFNVVNGTFTTRYDSIEHSGTYTEGARNTGTGTIDNGNNDAGTTGILDDTTVLQDGGPDGTHGAEIYPDLISAITRIPADELLAANDFEFTVRVAA